MQDGREACAVWLWYNRHALSRIFVLLLALLISLVSAGCSPSGAVSDAYASPTLRPYQEPTPSLTPSPLPAAAVSSPTPGPTATPFTHVVEDGDTLIGIAFTYGVTLEELLAANPGVDPRFLSVGHELIIPLGGPEGEGQYVPQITPVPVTLTSVTCYRTPSDGLWCVTAARGDTGDAVEGLAAVITLYDTQGVEAARETAYGPLNVLEPQASMPLAAFFPPPAPPFSRAMATILTAFELAEAEDRYLALDVDLEVLEALPGSTRWRLAGTATLSASAAGAASTISVLVIAVSAEGEIVGFNVWESANPVEPGETAIIELDLFSLGPPIASMEVLAEAQAQE
jgi:LysM repeat protein